VGASSGSANARAIGGQHQRRRNWWPIAWRRRRHRRRGGQRRQRRRRREPGAADANGGGATSGAATGNNTATIAQGPTIDLSGFALTITADLPVSCGTSAERQPLPRTASAVAVRMWPVMRRLRAPALLALLSTVAGATACGSSDATIAFRPLPPYSARPVPAPRDAPACAAPSARLFNAGEQGLNAATILYYVGLRNRGRRTCIVRGSLGVTVLGPRGAPIQVSFTSQPYGEQLPWRVAVEPGSSVGTTIVVSRLCADPLRQTTDVRYRVSLDGFRGLTKSGVGCTTGAEIQVSPFQGSVRRRPGRHWPLRARLDAPKTVEGGKTLHSVVELTNTSSRPFRFPYCPNYDLIGVAQPRSYTLNCKGVGAINPGARVRFALESRTPHTDHRWRSTLSFSTGPDDGDEITAEGTIVVVP
jgi:hypothetical protein